MWHAMEYARVYFSGQKPMAVVTRCICDFQSKLEKDLEKSGNIKP